MIITFVLLAFQEEHDYLVSLGSLMCQTNPNWKAIVLHNGPNPDLFNKIQLILPDERISWYNTEENNGTDTINREYAYNNLVNAEWVVSTSIQDYYLPKTVEEILKVAEGNDFIYWNSMNNHWLENAIFDTSTRIRGIDWGNFAIRSEMAKKVGIKIHRNPTADGQFVEDAMELAPKVIKIHKMLTIHN